MKENSMFYFAYGTLLDINVMKKIAPSVRSHGSMRLDGFRLDFAQCADGKNTGCTLTRDDDSVTYGIQYELSDEEMSGMDNSAVSGQELWVHTPITLTNSQKEQVKSITYLIPGDAPLIAPSDDYVRPILKGLDDLDFPQDYVNSMKKLIAKAQQRLQ